MKIKYYKEDDILVLRFSNKPVDDSFESGSSILEVDKKGEPVALEVLKASEFLAKAAREFPEEIKRQVFAY